MTILVEIHCARGNVAEARNLLEIQPDFRQSDDIQSRSGYLYAEARLLRAEGRLQDALAAAESVLALRADLGLSFLSVKLALVEAIDSAFELGDLAKVRELLGIIEELRPGELPPLLNAQGERFRASLAVAEGEAEAAVGGFSRAAAMFRELEMPFWLAVTLLEHGEWLIAQGHGEEAEPLLADAHKIFERLEATPWLERARQAVSVPA
jgi:tetratricopeptide (TPR) repeat protein